MPRHYISRLCATPPYLQSPRLLFLICYLFIYILSPGYCFGARFIIRLLAQRSLSAAVINHPSFHTSDELNALNDTTGPLAFYAAETDEIFTEARRREMEDSLKANGARWMGTVFSGVEHGFRYYSFFPQLSRFLLFQCLGLGHDEGSWGKGMLAPKCYCIKKPHFSFSPKPPYLTYRQ